MKIINSVAELKNKISNFKKENKSIGFVPTMGALHAGHISLIEYSTNENDITIVSIFVNPTQFNNPNDLATYPKTLDADLEKMSYFNPDFIFIPSVKEVYPEPDTRVFEFGCLENVMEGKNRPGHFNGVAQVVSRLFDMVEPNKAYFGLKDYQQLAVIKQMVIDLKLDIEIVPCPRVMEQDGLAMSSRNMLLLPEQRKNASKISETLFKACNLVPEKSVSEIKAWVIKEINETPLLEVEYFEIVDDTSLQPIESWNDNCDVIGCITVQVGSIRLIDNIKF